MLTGTHAPSESSGDTGKSKAQKHSRFDLSTV
jgi:hypothetical protein